MTKVILLTVDSLRKDHFNESLFQNIWAELDSDFALFENCYSNGTGTPASFPSIHSGIPYSGEQLQTDKPTLAESYDGYAWANCNNPNLTIDAGYARGFDDYKSPVSVNPSHGNNEGETSVTTFIDKVKEWGSRSLLIRKLYYNIGLPINKRFSEVSLRNDDILLAGEMTDQLLQAMEQNTGFFWAHYMDPHSPFHHEKIADRNYSPNYTIAEIKSANRRFRKQHPTEEDLKFIQEFYRESVKYLDRQFNRIFKHLKNEGRWDDAMVVLMSDHGEAFGAKGQFWHGRDLHPTDELVKTPLAVKYPNGKYAGNKYSHKVQNADLLATVAETLDMDVPRPKNTRPFTDPEDRMIVSIGGNTVRVTTESGYGIRSPNDETLTGDLDNEALSLLRSQPSAAELSRGDITTEAKTNRVEHQLEYLGYK